MVFLRHKYTIIMKLPLLLILSTLSTIVNAQSEVLSFDYDNAGNQNIREIICVSCRQNLEDQETSSRRIAEFLNSDIHDQISYYPNPVSEELFVKWQNKDEQYVIAIDVYSVLGNQVYHTEMNTEIGTATIKFSHLANGLYNLNLIYSDGEQKALKIIKK